MAKISQPVVKTKNRGYNQEYKVHVYEKSAKVDLQIFDPAVSIATNLKLSETECEELITRLTFALHQGREARNG